MRDKHQLGQQFTYLQYFSWADFGTHFPNQCTQNQYYAPVSAFTGQSWHQEFPYFYLIPVANQPPQTTYTPELPPFSPNEGFKPDPPTKLQKKVRNSTSPCGREGKKWKKIIELESIKDCQRNRNILSNCLKLALKNIRVNLQESDSYFQRITHAHKMDYSVSEFEETLRMLLPPDINYIRPAMVRQIFLRQCPKFSTVLKIYIRKFFKEEIYATTGRYTQMKKLIKNQHVKAGRKLLAFFFLEQPELLENTHSHE